mmetsp:Transcript_1900/g.4274  ORF Transcript_1900/g.4274 Transcript_1900/m.4274 type:complete len:225 (-) Transcript_1900:829-1503(-)
MAGDDYLTLLVGLVCAGVAHVRHVLKANLIARMRCPDSARHQVRLVGEGAAGATLREAIALQHRASKDDAQEVQHVVGDGGAPGDHETDPVEAYTLLDLGEHQAVPEAVREAARGQPSLLGGVTAVEHRLLQAACLLDTRAQLVVDPVQEARDRGEDRRSERLKIFQDLQGLALVEADGPAVMEHPELDDTLENVGQGQVREVHLLVREAKGRPCPASGHCRDE